MDKSRPQAALLFGGEEEDRTPDLRIANATLSELSYFPVRNEYINSCRCLSRTSYRHKWVKLISLMNVDMFYRLKPVTPRAAFEPRQRQDPIKWYKKCFVRFAIIFSVSIFQGTSMNKLFKKAAMTLAVAGMCSAGSAQAVTQLGFILDESGSIGSSNYTIIKNGLANAINTIIPTTGEYEISVVSFDSGSQILVNHVLIDSIAARTAVANLILADTFSGGTTAMNLGFSVLGGVLASSTLQIGSSYVNLATDGIPNDQNAATLARNALLAAGVDNISIEAIGSGVDANYLQNTICYPGPCDNTIPFNNFPNQGFYLAVADAQGYANAIGYKIQVVTNQTPEPESLALMSIGAMGLLLAARRRKHV
jgi:uncharacterized protein YegL